MNIGTTVKKLRLKSGMTQQQLADCLNVSMQTISRWETSVTYPDIVMLPILARYFGVSVDYLLNDGGNTMKTIESKNLIIRAWNNSDATELLELKRKSKDFVNYAKIDTMDEATAFVKIWQEYHELQPLILKATNKLIGIIGLVDVNRYKGYQELEVHICDEYNNVNYATEAHKLILDYGFGETDLLVAFSLCGNEESVLKQALVNTGFKYEGTLRKFGRDMSDRLRYSLIKEEYQS